jgi:hypothetical protein
MNKLSYSIRLAGPAAALALLVLPHTMAAQGKGKDKGKDEKKIEKAEVKSVDKAAKVEVKRDKAIDKAEKVDVKRDKAIDKAQLKSAKHVTTLQGVNATRDVLLANGYQVVNVVPSGTSQVIYYRRGNMGNGRGLGPVQKIVVVPAGQVVQFQSVPQSLLSTILARLGM